MPDIGTLHPQLVHFVIALGLVGVVLRLISLVARGVWLGPAAAALIMLSAAAGVLAAKSGDDAHENAERIPGVRAAVQLHEHWGERTRNVLLAVAGLEIIALLFASSRAGRPLRFVAAAGGLVAAFCIYKVSDLGGDIVYEYAGGVGTRSGDPEDIDHLLVAGLFYGARLDRDSGRAEAAARLIDELARRRPADTTIRFLVIESQLRDRNDPAGALAGLAALQLPPSHRLAPRHGLLLAQALVASGQVDSARVILSALTQRFPENQALKSALERLR
jgi:uncharacterized membrane protein